MPIIIIITIMIKIIITVIIITICITLWELISYADYLTATILLSTRSQKVTELNVKHIALF
jgi:hypothetical protein